ncbi:phosphatidylinositol phosphatase PTPRQ-like isoform X2 [Haliotis rufescens]|uniref:phosphatidylinositol phosphatase PTPRQ-like isoform X2 n=1 Tax=Haliotis rufescens TaxID=6454 RepID=UPI00201FA5BC|nr:phosphatidylinositol phosphatase PTPRQ-like isoform X2 [Haliotis rufescens]
MDIFVGWCFMLAAFSIGSVLPISTTELSTTSTPEHVPGKVNNLKTTVTTSSSLGLSWTASTSDVPFTQYIVFTSKGGECLKAVYILCPPNDSIYASADCNSVMAGATATYDECHGDMSYNVTDLDSNTDYVVSVAAAANFTIGENSTLKEKTHIGNPSAPKDFNASVNNESSVTLSWTPAVHRGGPTTYIITVEEETRLNSNIFEEARNISVRGFNASSLVIGDLRSYWKYTFNIIAETPAGRSEDVFLSSAILTKESAPGKVEDLWIDAIPDNLTAVNVTFTCPIEAERHGVILYYTLSYVAQETHEEAFVIENRQGYNISSGLGDCSFTSFVSITPNVNYVFSVVAHDSFTGAEQKEVFFGNPGEPGEVTTFTMTSTTSTSITLSWQPPRLHNGFILGYVLYVHTEDGACQQAVNIVCTDCQSDGTFRAEDKKCHSYRNASIQRPGYESQTSYAVTSLMSYTNYTVTVAAVNNATVGDTTTLTYQTEMGVPATPTIFSAAVINESAVYVTWMPPGHKSGPTIYTISVLEAAGRKGKEFDLIRNVLVKGYTSDHVAIGDLLSSWRYKFSITASTSEGSSPVLDTASTSVTKGSVPGQVRNLTVSSLPGNFTAVNLTWECPNERERNGFIKNYTIKCSDPGTPTVVYGHYEPEDPCTTHTAILPVRPENNYTFTVFANAMYAGRPGVSYVFYAVAGKPPPKTTTDIFINTAAQDKHSTDTFFTVSFNKSTLLDSTNGNIIEAGFIVMQKSETSSGPGNVTSWNTWMNWYRWKKAGYKGSYRPTPEHYLIQGRRRRGASTENDDALTSFLVGSDGSCDNKQDQFCNGPLEPETVYKVMAVACTNAGCTSTKPFGHFRTSSRGTGKDMTPWIAFGVTATVLLCTIISFVVYMKVIQPARKLKSYSEGHHLALSDRNEHVVNPKRVHPYKKV